ncbi:hypothetical protein E1292_49665 [Nonomuraea deserti]|uniref:GAF domain-containing protein n=1 Tax=Nonomuraea deserti TaxID=1848322 RepID=A0A4R4U015_9ACTN|nr:hypothetical protein [Nonomuraea deserti]TDC84050.1 hypothetical protein E1292_49665 [Nonomuraea deserti]
MPLLTALTRHIRAREVDSFLGGDGYLIPVTWFSDLVTRNGEVLGMTVLFTGDATDREAADGLAAHVTALEDLTGRLALVTEIATTLAQTLDTEEALARLGRLLVPRLADRVAIDLRTDEGSQRVAVIGPEGRDADQEAWRGPLPALDGHSCSSLVRVLHGGEPVLIGPGDIAAPSPSSRRSLWPRSSWLALRAQMRVTWQLRWTNAGHPPPLLVTPDTASRSPSRCCLVISCGDDCLRHRLFPAGPPWR